MAFKAYDTNDPSSKEHPTKGHISLLKYYKKAISYFIPNCQLQWNELAKFGNHTRLDEVNDLIAVVMK
eukprot:6404460-Ditylum_brightwellii.AAC.1